MSMRLLPATLRAMRALAVAALVCAAIAAYSAANYRYHQFFAGATIGVLLVLIVMLFRAPAAEVEIMPHESSNSENNNSKSK
jgi:4-hydroxybenzoate polyprenyltransferase